MQNLINKAIKFEILGQKKEALLLYKEILNKDSNQADALAGVKRLSGIRKKFLGVNEDKKMLFLNMKDKKDFLEFERWLI